MPGQQRRSGRALVGTAAPRGIRERLRERSHRKAALRRRAALLAADPQLRGFTIHGFPLAGRLTSRFTAAEAAEANLRLVVDCLEATGATYFLVPGRSPLRHVVGVLKTDKKAFLDAMRERYGDTEVYAAKASSGDDVLAGPVLYAAGASRARSSSRGPCASAGSCSARRSRCSRASSTAATSSSGRPARTSPPTPRSRARTSSSKCRSRRRCSRARWSRPARTASPTCSPPRSARSVPHRGRAQVPEPAALHARLIDEVDFPVDAVYMWVDGNDPILGREAPAFISGTGTGTDAGAEHTHLTGASRYTSRDELRYALRSLHTFAPFIRNVYIVTAGQTPDWLDPEAPGIRVVDHAEIFTDPAALPVFSSHAIATQLHHIRGLADHYLVLNDDVFFGVPSQAEKFFHANGVARLPFSPLQIGSAPPAPRTRRRTPRARTCGPCSNPTSSGSSRASSSTSRTRSCAKSPSSSRRATPSRWPRPPARASATPPTSSSPRCSTTTTRCSPAAPCPASKLSYVDISHDDAARQLKTLAAGRDAEYFCLNDVDTPPDREAEINAMVRGFLDHYFPFPSPYEKT